LSFSQVKDDTLGLLSRTELDCVWLLGLKPSSKVVVHSSEQSVSSRLRCLSQAHTDDLVNGRAREARQCSLAAVFRLLRYGLGKLVGVLGNGRLTAHIDGGQ
jgi:hypothetical protein